MHLFRFYIYIYFLLNLSYLFYIYFLLNHLYLFFVESLIFFTLIWGISKDIYNQNNDKYKAIQKKIFEPLVFRVPRRYLTLSVIVLYCNLTTFLTRDLRGSDCKKKEKKEKKKDFDGLHSTLRHASVPPAQ